MWALMNGLEAELWAFTVFHTRKEARRCRGAGEKIIQVEVRELKTKRGGK